MSEERKQEKRQDVIFMSPEGGNMKVVCRTMHLPERIMGGNTMPRISRKIKPRNGIYVLRANALYYDEQETALKDFARRYGLKKIASLSEIKVETEKKSNEGKAEKESATSSV